MAGVRGRGAGPGRGGAVPRPSSQEQAAQRADPGAYAPHLYLGSMFLAEGNAVGAVAQYRQFLADGPPRAEVQCRPAVHRPRRSTRPASLFRPCRVRPRHRSTRGADHATATRRLTALGSGSKGAQLGHDAGERGRERIDVVVGRGPPHRQPQRALGVDTHGLEHGRRRQRLRRARRARVGGDAALVEPQEDGLGLDPADGHAHQMGRSAVRVAEHLHAVDGGGRRQDGVGAPPGLGRLASSLPGAARTSAAAPNPMMPGTFSRPPRRARSCSPPTSNGSTRKPAPHHQRADPGRPAELVGAHRHEIGAERRRGPARRARPRCTRRRARARRGVGTPRPPRAPAARCPPRGWPPGSARGRGRALPAALSRASSTAAGRCDRDRRPPGARPGRPAPTRRGPRSARRRRARWAARVGPGSPPTSPRWTASVPPEVNTDLARPGAKQRRRPARGLPPPRPGRCGLRCGPARDRRRSSPDDSSQPTMAATTSGRGGEVEAWSR